MNNQKLVTRLLVTAWTLYILAAVAPAADEMAKGFTDPPPNTRPWCYWYWISDNLSKDGITRDLEAMARVGIGEALIGNIVDQDTPLGDVELLSDEWFSLTTHAIKEAKRVGVNISMFNGPGWSQSGGPWVKPTQAMRYVISSETRVKGPEKFVGKLPVPKEPFQDIAVLAFPTPQSDTERIPTPNVRCDPKVENRRRMFDGDLQTDCPFPEGTATKEKPWVIHIETDKPFTARSLTLHPGESNFSVICELQAADDAGKFRAVRQFKMDRRGLGRPKYRANVGFMIWGPVVVAFDPVTSRQFRLVVSHMTGDFINPNGVGAFAEIILSGAARIERIVEKQLGKTHSTTVQLPDVYLWPPSAEPDNQNLLIEPDKIVTLTDRLDSNGILRWDVPNGDWVILRSGMTTTNAVNHPTTDQGRGLECDKMSRTAIQAHFNGFMARVLKRVPETAREAMKRIVIDSYEVGSQNWTDGFHESFQEAFGYDPRPWLPVLTGRIIGSADHSDRFLWDFRRHIADRIATNYVGGLRDIVNRHGLRLWLENYGHWGFPGTFLHYGGQSNDLGGEFWVRESAPTLGSGNELRAASSAAHIYGKRVVHAEAFTSARSFMDSPANIKALGDGAYCHGINLFVLHVYIHQPWEDRKPGVNAWFGTEFNRQNTWFEQSKTWIYYLRRCHFMLQQGTNVADVAYFIGEDAPKMIGARQPELPEGHGYDYINADVLFNRASVQNGRVTLPDGTSYSLLVLPPRKTMRPELLRRIRDLVDEGAVLLGPPPQRSPSLQDYPTSDQEVKRLSAELWGEISEHNGRGLVKRAFGKGLVFSGDDLTGVLKQLKTEPDITCPEGIMWSHRKSDKADIYFISNQINEPMLADISFRVSDRAPELWHPDTGKIETIAWFESRGSRTNVPVSLDAHGSAFVVFRRPAEKASVALVKRNGKSITASEGKSPISVNWDKSSNITASVTQSGRYTLVGADKSQNYVDVKKVPAPIVLSNPWRVRFPEGSGIPKPINLSQLQSWSEHSDDAVRHFSGTATYETTLKVASDLLQKGRRLTVDLGNVQDIAQVRVNGKDLGVLWKKPFTADITDAVRAGNNRLEVEVTNTWWNRLVGDEKLPKDQRKTFTTARSRVPRKELVPAGLLGPVTLQFAQEVTVNRCF